MASKKDQDVFTITIDLKQPLSYEQAGTIFGCAARTLHRLVESGRVGFLKVGNQVRFDYEELKEALRVDADDIRIGLKFNPKKATPKKRREVAGV